MQSKKEYLVVVRNRYAACVSRQNKSAIIDEVVTNLHIERKSAIRLLNTKPLVRRKTLKSRKVIYSDDLIRPLKTIWEVAGKPCSKRLQPQLKDLIAQLLSFNELTLYGNQQNLLETMSSYSIDRLLSGERVIYEGRGVSGTKTSPLLKTLIPVRTNFTETETQEPGHIEMDCVLHCGESLSGIYAETLNMLDIATHWNEKRIFLKKTKGKIVGGVHDLKRQFPFPVLSIDFDNGFEFVNWILYGYCKREGIAFTRSRSYHKNDQARIEGKNYQSVRKVAGYERISDERIVTLLDDIYQNEHRLLTNFFYTTLKLKNKKKINGKTRKSYEKAKTPYQRCLESDTITDEVKLQLQKQYQNLNPAELQRQLQKKLQNVYRLMRSVTKINLAMTE